MTYRVYPDMLDCVWLAVDCEQNLGVFITGGSGPIPVCVLHGTSFPIEDVEVTIDQLPEASEVCLLVHVKRPDTFYDIAKKGFFVYDWRDVSRTIREFSNKYESVASPVNPITLEDLPAQLKQVALQVEFSNVCFAKRQALDVESEVECCRAN